MGRVVAIGVVALLFAGCAGRARPGEPGDTRNDGAVQVPAGLRGEVVESPGEPELPPVTERAELEPLPLPQGVVASDFDIDLQYNGRVAYWLQYYRKYGDTFTGSLERMGRYEPYIRRELTSAGLPGDLIYLALIESGFVPAATSRARAVGIWQFMAETARMEGLEISTYIDERRDPIRATQAAVRHLRALYRELGSWYLVAAAYNSGSGRVARALEGAAGGARGADSLFWRIDLTLPRETRDYVPQFIAASILAKYPDRFGLGSERRLPDDYETVKIDRPTDLAAVARAARASEDAVRRLNPQFLRGVTPPGRTVAVRVPAGHADGVRARLAAMPRRERVHNLRHTVDGDDTPQSIARAYGVSLAALRKANHLKKKTKHLALGRELVIPLVPPARLADEAPSRKGGEKLAASERTAPDANSGSRDRTSRSDADAPSARDRLAKSDSAAATPGNGGTRADADGASATPKAALARGDADAEPTPRKAALAKRDGDASSATRKSGGRKGDTEAASPSTKSRLASRDGRSVTAKSRLDEDGGESVGTRSRLARGDGESVTTKSRPAKGDGGSRATKTRPAKDDGGSASARSRLARGGAESASVKGHPAKAGAKRPAKAEERETIASADLPEKGARRTTAKPAPAAGKRLVYRVRPGDTLSGIARKHGVTVRELREWNGLAKSDVLRAGERVEIRPGG